MSQWVAHHRAYHSGAVSKTNRVRSEAVPKSYRQSLRHEFGVAIQLWHVTATNFTPKRDSVLIGVMWMRTATAT